MAWVSHLDFLEQFSILTKLRGIQSGSSQEMETTPITRREKI